MNIIYSFVSKRRENMSDIVSVHWQQGKFQLCANCFMSWRPVSNADLGISKTPSAAHWCVQRPKYSAMSRMSRSPVNSPHKGQWRGALMFSLICVWINDWVNNRKAGDLRRYHAHYDVTVMNLWHINYITTCRNNHFIQPSEVLPVVCNSAKRNAAVPRNEHDAMR